MRRTHLTSALLFLLSSVFMLGWTTEESPTGDTTTITRGDVIYADEGSTIRIFQANGRTWELVESFATDQASTHDDTRDSRRRRHRHSSFTCSCTHTHDPDDRHHYDPYDPCDPCHAVFAASDDQLAYVYERTTVVVVDISTPVQPREVSRVDVGWEVEAIEVVDGAFVLVGDQERKRLDAMEVR